MSELDAYTVSATAEVLGISIHTVYACIEDGRLERAHPRGGGVRLVAGVAVEEVLADPTILKPARGPRIVERDDSRSALGPVSEEVVAALNAGMTMTDIGERYGVTRERVRQWANRYIPLEERKRQCVVCDEYLAPEVAYSRRMHEHCRDEHQHNLSREVNALKSWHQREKLNETQTLAAEEYRRRGYDVNWAPAYATFNFLVNGKRVAVLGSRVHGDKGFDWSLRPCGAGHNPDLYIDLTTRCDIYHCIGIDDDGERYDLLLTSEEAGARFRLHLTPRSLARNTCPNLKYADRWELLEREETR